MKIFGNGINVRWFVSYMAVAIYTANNSAKRKDARMNAVSVGRVGAFHQAILELGDISIKLKTNSGMPCVLRFPVVYKTAVVNGKEINLYEEDWNDVVANIMEAIEKAK